MLRLARSRSRVCPHCAGVPVAEFEEVEVSGRTKAPRGAGSYLRAMLKRLGYKSKAGCKCNHRARMMNKKGTEWCKANIDTIVGWLREEAERQKAYFFEQGAVIIVNRAIGLAERRSTS